MARVVQFIKEVMMGGDDVSGENPKAEKSAKGGGKSNKKSKKDGYAIFNLWERGRSNVGCARLTL